MDNFAKLEDADAYGNAREIRNRDMVNPIPPRNPTVRTWWVFIPSGDSAKPVTGEPACTHAHTEAHKWQHPYKHTYVCTFMLKYVESTY